MRALLLAYGGVAALQWFQTSVLGVAGAEDAGSYQAWLRDGTLALPFVLAAILFATRRTRPGTNGANLSLAAMYAAVMGAGALLHQAFPTDAHAGHEAPLTSNLDAVRHVVAIMVAAGVFALVVDRLLGQVNLAVTAPPDGMDLFARLRLPVPHRARPVVWAFAIMLVVTPVLVFSPSKEAVAATNFPDQPIHPRGTLTLIAQVMPDGSMAYIAPDFGAQGVRPVIEMTEGEVLNITLKNQLSVDVSLHVHGVHYKIDSDGTRHSNSFVKAGQQRTYQWDAAVGTAGYWHYHDHVVGDDEGTSGIAGGLYGGLVVRKAGAPKPMHTFVVVGQDKTLNGAIYPDTPTFTARQGELVEFLVISHGSRVHTFHLHGHRWITPNRPADPNPANPANVGSGLEDNHILAPGDSFGFMVIAGDGVGPGMWMYHCHFQDHASAMKGFFQVLPPGPSAQVETSRFFKETGKTVAGRFLEYWDTHGGLAQQGFPLSEPFQEKSDLDGKTYTVQYFERSVFEAHPENPKPYDVLLSQLGTFRYKEKYPAGR